MRKNGLSKNKAFKNLFHLKNKLLEVDVFLRDVNKNRSLHGFMDSDQIKWPKITHNTHKKRLRKPRERHTFS